MITIKQEVIDKIKGSQAIKGRLAYEFAKTTKTIDAWLNENDIMLTTAVGLRAISEELNMPESELITEVA